MTTDKNTFQYLLNIVPDYKEPHTVITKSESGVNDYDIGTDGDLTRITLSTPKNNWNVRGVLVRQLNGAFIEWATKIDFNKAYFKTLNTANQFRIKLTIFFNNGRTQDLFVGNNVDFVLDENGTVVPGEDGEGLPQEN